MTHELGLVGRYWGLLSIVAIALSLYGCGDVSSVSAPPPGPAALAIASSSPLPSGSIGIPYSTTLAASGGNPGYSWSLANGSPALPNGLNLSSAGVISGTPTTIQTVTPKFRVVDTSTPTPQAVEKDLTISINAVPQPTISAPAVLPNGIVGQSYPSTQLTATGGTPPYTTWSVNPALPSGLSFSTTTGTISGTPTAASNLTHTFSVTDSFSPTPQTGTRQYTLTISPAPLTLTITTNSPLPSGTVTQAYGPVQLAATGGTPPLTWDLAPGSPALPNGLQLSSGGVLNGTPSSAANVTPVFRVRDVATSPQQTATKPLAITINLPAAPNITTTSLPNGNFNQNYNQTLSVSGGTAPFFWSFNGQLPPGLGLNSSSGAISGIATQTGTFNFTPQVVDATLQSDLTPPALSITIVAPSFSITTASPLPVGTVNQTYPTTTLQATGGTPSYTWDPVVTPALPNGLTWTAATATISGIPLAGSEGTALHTFTVRDSTNPIQTVSKPLSLTINAALTINNPSPLPSGTVGQTYTAGTPLVTLTASGGTGGYHNWLVTPSLPTGLTLNNSTGAITGTPTVASPATNYQFSVQDSSNQTATKSLSLTINAALTINNPSPLPSGTVGQTYTAGTPLVTLTASGGTGGYHNWLVTPSLPTGLTLNNSTGAITGTPTVASPATNYQFSVQDSSNQTVNKTLNLTVN